MVPMWLQKFQNGPASFWDLFSSYLAQSSYLVRNNNFIFGILFFVSIMDARVLE